jgi:hypothetical protein
VWIRTKITTESRIRPQHVKRVAYDGTVHCFSVPHGIYVTRRNGRIAIQGNTFWGDASVGTLATAHSLDRPTELMMLDRQSLWRDVFLNIFNFVILWGVKAPQGILKGMATVRRDVEDGQITEYLDWPDDANDDISIAFPPLLEHDVPAMVTATVQAATLGAPGTLAGTMELPDLSRILLTLIGVPDTDEIVERMFPDGTAPEAETPPATDAPERPAAESLMVSAVRELRASLLALRENGVAA